MNIAFIPVRGGSKSIPLKNIKLFCGKPLVVWNIEALENCNAIDKVIVATDSVEIETVVSSYSWKKTEIFHRSAENACDTASTESVMLEYIAAGKLSDTDTFILVQATSPLTESEHFDAALDMYKCGEFDSILTCVKNYRFFWNEDGSSKNYDYMNRPRRQDFDGVFMENGAFYINSVKNVKEYKNRLSGKIGIYEMPEYTATEIDEPDDWIILENLKRRHLKKQSNRIKLVLSDVDGVLTDGGMYYSESGDELKKFNTKDGMGFQLLRENNIKTGIITSEETKLVERRALKLKVDFLKQGKGFKSKKDVASDICKELGISLEEVAYIGDDINDLELLSSVGFPFCPNNAMFSVKQVPGIQVLSLSGGMGVFRELVERVLGF